MIQKRNGGQSLHPGKAGGSLRGRQSAGNGFAEHHPANSQTADDRFGKDNRPMTPRT